MVTSVTCFHIDLYLHCLWNCLEITNFFFFFFFGKIKAIIVMEHSVCPLPLSDNFTIYEKRD